MKNLKQLRFTTTEPHGMFETWDEPLVKPNNIGEMVMDKLTRGKGAYIHGDAETKAKFDIPFFLDGNLSQLELPIEEQNILMLLPDGEYQCKAEYIDEPLCSDCYLITLK